MKLQEQGWRLQELQLEAAFVEEASAAWVGTSSSEAALACLA